MIKIIIDTREKSTIWETSLELKSFHKERKQLDIGDIWITTHHPDKPNDDQVLVIIERKTLNDLAASIKDGRYREQKMRFLNSDFGRQYANRIIYLIEGTITDKSNINGIPGKTLKSAIMNMIVRDNIKMYFTVDLNETVAFISSLSEKFQNPEFIEKFHFHCPLNPTNPVNSSNQSNFLPIEQEEYIESLSIKKKINKDPTQCYLAQLCQIPGVSIKTASAIAKRYPTFIHMISEYYQVDESERPELLKDVVYLEGNRKIGKALSNKIYQYLFHQL